MPSRNFLTVRYHSLLVCRSAFAPQAFGTHLRPLPLTLWAHHNVAHAATAISAPGLTWALVQGIPCPAFDSTGISERYYVAQGVSGRSVQRCQAYLKGKAKIPEGRSPKLRISRALKPGMLPSYLHPCVSLCTSFLVLLARLIALLEVIPIQTDWRHKGRRRAIDEYITKQRVEAPDCVFSPHPAERHSRIMGERLHGSTTVYERASDTLIIFFDNSAPLQKSKLLIRNKIPMSLSA